VAVTGCEPATVWAVMPLLAWPLAPVVAVAALGKVALAPLAGAANVTLTPGTGLLYWSRTVATSGLAKAVLTVALWPEPDVTTMWSAAPAVLVSLKLAGVPTSLAVAVRGRWRWRRWTARRR